MKTNDGLELIISMKASGPKEGEIEKCKNDSRWIADCKLDGHYFTAYYFPDLDKRVRFFSGNISVKTGIFTERTENLMCLQKDFEDKSFIVCGEIVHSLGKDAITSVIGGLPKHSIIRQKELGEPSFVLFDILYWNGNSYLNVPYEERRNLLERFRLKQNFFMDFLLKKKDIFYKNNWYVSVTNSILNIPILDTYDYCINEGFEGVIYKLKSSLYEPGYISNGVVRCRRTRNWIKHKKKRQFDVVIIGYTDAEYGVTGKYDGMIGAIKFGQYKYGILTEIGQCSGFIDDLRIDITNNREKYIGKVMVIESQERSSKNDRMRHAQFKGFHPEKRAEDCIYNEWET